ncbi:MAG: glycoside hydrolase family 9 protein, partial [Candidatus Promineifilaceae bacterium]
INVNQVGYFPDSPKIAAFASVSTTPIPWTLSQAGTEMASGSTIMIGDDASSGDFLHQIDFSEFKETGHDYVLEAGELVSEPFDISESVYAGLKEDALEYFYLSRSGIELEQSYAGEWARAAGHMSDDKVTCYRGEDADGNHWPGCDYTIDASGGWYDAGDYGKYVVNGGITTWTLLNMYERNPDSFPDGSLSIPEANNGNSDLLDEARWEIEFLLSMQVPEGQEKAGLVHHKLHDRTWETMPALPVTERDNDNENQDPEDGRYLYMPTTAATLNLAAVGAQCARIWEEIDPDFAAECLRAAEIAWGAAVENPTIFAGNTPGSGGGNYDDQNVSDEFYWAAAELFTTTGEAEYYDFLNETPLLGSLPTPISSMTWDNTAALGTLTLALVPNQLEEEVVAELRENIISAADHYLNVLDREGYRMPISSFEWGSNSFILNNMIVMGYAFEFTGDDAYLNGMTESMDYLMGRNPVSMSYVTGFGERAAQHPHHRFWANDPDRGWPAPPPGVVVGGPNATADDPPFNSSGLNDMAAAKRYLDDLESFSTNEVAINWNAPLVWTATAIEEYKSGIIPDRQAIGAPAESADAGSQTTSDSESDEDSGSLPAWPIFVGIGVLAIAGFVIGWRLRKNPKAAEK